MLPILLNSSSFLHQRPELLPMRISTKASDRFLSAAPDPGYAARRQSDR
jgi:hypothetical protein